MALAYRLHLVNSRWAVYDVLIEGVSFVGNYRSQFNRIISKGSYEDLVRKLKTGGLEGATLDRLERAAGRPLAATRPLTLSPGRA
jgi:hypothetical protein